MGKHGCQKWEKFMTLSQDFGTSSFWKLDATGFHTLCGFSFRTAEFFNLFSLVNNSEKKKHERKKKVGSKLKAMDFSVWEKRTWKKVSWSVNNLKAVSMVNSCSWQHSGWNNFTHETVVKIGSVISAVLCLTSLSLVWRCFVASLPLKKAQRCVGTPVVSDWTDEIFGDFSPPPHVNNSHPESVARHECHPQPAVQGGSEVLSFCGQILNF